MTTPTPTGICADHHAMCKSWADSGECKKNPPYMVGGKGSIGQCRLSCGTCEVCTEGDLKCVGRNRAAMGFLPLDELD